MDFLARYHDKHMFSKKSIYDWTEVKVEAVCMYNEGTYDRVAARRLSHIQNFGSLPNNFASGHQRVNLSY